MNSNLTSSDQAPFIVAELSGNHGGSLKKALELVDAAKISGAHAIKLQTYKPETITVNSKDDRFLIKEGLWKGKYLHDLYHQAMTPWEWHSEIARKAKENELVCFSSPFDETAVDFLEEEISPSLYKIASFELNHFPLLKKVAALQKTVIASTGVSNEEEILKAIKTLRDNGCPEIILLHCVSNYPAKLEDFNLSLIPWMQKTFNCKVGLSDHSPGHLIPVLATALGARVIEKHLTLDRSKSSIDGDFSLLPEEFKVMSQSVLEAYKSMGGHYSKSKEIKIRFKNSSFKRSILACKKIQSGDLLTKENIRIARPGHGMCPSKWTDVLGKKVKRNLEIGDPLVLRDLEV
mgnify:FL=1